ncbi:MotA/TolQ/ExbB proton channel family protein [Oceanicola sp. 502str15]|nr:MotA/TolQ/ExbB proton channel family protein [Oceanicola sp. 502str15]
MEAPEAPAAPQAESGADAGVAVPSDSTEPLATEATSTADPVPEIAPEPALTPVQQMAEFLWQGGPAIWAIAALSVLTLALILWKIWRYSVAGAWSRKASFSAVDTWVGGQRDAALQALAQRRGVRSRMTHAAMQARLTLEEESAREEVSRVAKRELSRLSGGLRVLELIATIAPLLGLLGTVLGMIDAFQTLQEAGNRADPALLAGGIWEALLTTAAGMAVAIPASIALTWFESIRDGVREDMEDIAARLFVQEVPPKSKLAQAAE